MPETPDYRELYNSMLEAFNSLNEAFSIFEIIRDEKGQAVDYRYLEICSYIEKSFGKSRAEIVGKTRRQLFGINVDPSDVLLKKFDEIDRTGMPAKFETYSLANGHCLEIYGWKVGKKLAMIYSDITERKKGEEALKESEDRLQHALEAGELGLWGLNVMTGKAWRTLQHDQIFGYNNLLPEWTYQMFLSHVVPEDRSYVDEKFGGALSSGSEWNFECRIQRPNGEIRWIWAQGKPKFDEKHAVVQMIGLVKDITERKKAEEELSYQADLLSKVNDAVFGIDNNHKINYWNKAAEKLFGYSKQEALGKNSADLLKPTVEGSSADQAFQNLQDNTAFKGEVQYTRKNGTNFSADVNTGSIKDANGKLLGAVAIVRDITERKKAEEALAKSEQRWATTLSSIGDAVIATDSLGNIVFMNQEAESLTGWKLGEASQKRTKTVFNIINERTRLEVESPIERVLKEGIVVGLANHTVLVQKDGKEIPVDDSGAPIRDRDGKITGVVLVFRDVTERRQAQQEHERLSAIVESTDDAIIGKTLDGIITSWNQAAEKLYGYTANEIIGKPISIVIPTDRMSEFQLILDKLSRGERIEHRDTVRLHKDGTHLDVDVTVAPIKDRYGEIVGASTIARDITERKKAELALKKSERRAREGTEELQKIMDIIPAAVWLSRDPECRQIVGNQAANRFYEADVGENVSAGPASGKEQDTTRRFFKNGRELLPQELPMQEAASKNKEIKGSELEVLLPSGVKRTILGSAKPLLDDKGKVRGCLGAFVDISERKKMEEALKQRTEQLEQTQVKLEENAVQLEEYSSQMEELAEQRANQLKDAERLAAIGATAGMVGHDIRNPLQAITGDLFLARSELANLPDNKEKLEALESLGEIEKNVDYINKIVADLQDYARPLNPRAQETNIKSLFNEILIKNGIPKNIKVTVEVEDSAEKIMADPDYLKRIAANLTLNAAQAMPNGGKLTISVYVDKQTNDTLITVEDTGVGIPESIKPKLFTPMMTTKSKGQGFGLAVVKRMSEGLGGTVTFESTEGKGTTFIVRLPPPRAKR